MAFAKFQQNRFRIDREIAKNHAILVNLTSSINKGLFLIPLALLTLMLPIFLNYISFIWSWNSSRNFQLQMTKNNYIYEKINILMM